MLQTAQNTKSIAQPQKAISCGRVFKELYNSTCKDVKIPNTNSSGETCVSERPSPNKNNPKTLMEAYDMYDGIYCPQTLLNYNQLCS